VCVCGGGSETGERIKGDLLFRLLVLVLAAAARAGAVADLRRSWCRGYPPEGVSDVEEQDERSGGRGGERRRKRRRSALAGCRRGSRY